jgi:hypothetical protein
MPTFTATCRNCGIALHGEFCSSCGQGHRHDRLRATDWIADVVERMTNVESSRILHTVVELTLRPGRMVRDYVDGKRVGYVNPARYAFAACALWWFAVALNESEDVWWRDFGQFANLASVPVVTLLVQLAFVSSRLTYAEHLAFMLFTSAQLYLVRALLALPYVVASPSSRVLGITDIVLTIAYLAWALWTFHRGRISSLPFRIVGALLGLMAVSTALDSGLRFAATGRLFP